MTNEHLATYLRDHLAGSVVAIELLEHLEEVHAGTGVATTLARLREDVLADQDVLEGLIGRVGGTAGTARAAAAWVEECRAYIRHAGYTATL